MKRILLALISVSYASSAFAGECKMSVTRTACAGKEVESYKKCAGKASCEEVKKVGSAEACAKEALKACENMGDRQKITKSKVITATFAGQPVEAGKNFCEANRSDFNKCQ